MGLLRCRLFVVLRMGLPLMAIGLVHDGWICRICVGQRRTREKRASLETGGLSFVTLDCHNNKLQST